MAEKTREEDEIRIRAALLKKHFPNKKLWDGHLDFFMTKEYLLADELSKSISRSEEFEKLEAFAKSASELWTAYSALSLQAKGTISRESAQPERTQEFDPQSHQGKAAEQFYGHERIRRDLLKVMIGIYRAVHGHNPEHFRHFPNASEDEGMIAYAKRNLAKYSNLSSKAKRSGAGRKIQLVDTARRIWEHYTGSEAPRKTAGKFADFVQDLLIYVEKAETRGWSVENVLSTWAKYNDR